MKKLHHKLATIFILLLLQSVSFADYDQRYGHWVSANINGIIHTHFIPGKLSKVYKSRGFSGINLGSPNRVRGGDKINKNGHLATIPYYQKQIDNYGLPRGEGKWAGYGTMGRFGHEKNK